MIKNFVSVVIASALFAGILSGCSDATKERKDTEKINITFSFWEPGVYNELENGLRIVVDEYEKLHPEVHIELISQPVAIYNEWIKQQVTRDTLPDIQSNSANVLAKQYKAGLVVDISDFLNNESEYSSGCLWKDTFIPERYEQSNMYYTWDGCNIPFFGTELAIFYNKDIYRELGLEEPKTWREFMHNCEVIKNSGKIPIAFMTQKRDARKWVYWHIFGGMYAQKYLGDSKINLNGDLNITREELARAVLSGDLNFKSRDTIECYKNYYNYLKEYLSYCTDSLELEESIAKAMFLNGEAVHINTGSWDAQSLLKDNSKDFEAGVFKFPEFTKEDSEYAGKRMSASSVQSIAVTKSVYTEEGKLEAAVDFLQYFTSKDVYQKFVNESAQLPVVKDVSIDESLECFVNDGYPPCDIFDFMDHKYSLVYDIIVGKNIILDDEFFDNLQKAAVEEAEEMAAEANISNEEDYYRTEKRFGVFNKEGS